MRLRSPVALLGAALLLTACGGTGSGSASLDTDDQKASYGIGMDMGRSLQPAEGRLDMPAFIKGLEDAMGGADPALDETEIQTALQAFSQSIMEAQQAEQAAAAEKNLTEGAAYLAENAAREGVMTTESGLQYEILREGNGPSPTAEQTAKLHYRGTLVDGTEFDTSYGGEPAQFPVGQVIPGFSEALQLMSAGAHFRVVIPGEIAYGPAGAGEDIGPNAVLIFEIEMLEIVE